MSNPSISSVNRANSAATAAENSDVEMNEPPKDPAAAAEEYKAQANNLYKAGKYSEALDLYSKSIELQPQNGTYYANRSAARTMLRQHREAVNDCRQALSLDPYQVKVYSRASKALVYMGDLQAASDMLRSGTRVCKERKALWEHCSKFNEELSLISRIDGLVTDCKNWLKEGKFDKGLRAIESAITLADPSIIKTSTTGISKLSPQTNLENICNKWKILRAECLLGLRDLGEAAKVIQSVLYNESTNSEALTVRAEILYVNDSHPVTHVQQVLQQALAFDPDNKRARALLKRVKLLESIKKEGNDAYQKGNWEEAEAAYTRFLEEDATEGAPGSQGVIRVKVLSNRAIVRSKANKHNLTVADCTAALELLEKLMFTDTSSNASDPSPADCKDSVQSALFLKLYLRRADSYFKQEVYDEACRDYTSADTIKPNDREIQAALRKTQQAQKAAKRKDYYKILGIGRDASEAEIKKAYRKLALQYHPDKQASLPEEERLACDTKFKEVSEAYSVLSDPQKKHLFDSGHDIDGSSASGGGGSPFGPGGMDPNDILRMFMQGGGKGGMGGMGGFGGGGFGGGGYGHGGHGGHGGYGGGGHSFHFG